MDHLIAAFAEELDKTAGPALAKLAFDIKGKVNEKIDQTAFDLGNAQLKTKLEMARRYGRGAVRKLGLDPDNPEHQAALAGGAGATVLGSSAIKRKLRKREMESAVRSAGVKAEKARKAARAAKFNTLRRMVTRGR